MRQLSKRLLLIIFLASLIGPVARSEVTLSGLTHGNVQISLKKGETTQDQVLKAFGPPNIMTLDAQGQEVWTYQRSSTMVNSQQKNRYGTLILAGASSRTVGLEQFSRTMTLIIKFDGEKKVSDFKSNTTNF